MTLADLKKQMTSLIKSDQRYHPGILSSIDVVGEKILEGLVYTASHGGFEGITLNSEINQENNKAMHELTEAFFERRGDYSYGESKTEALFHRSQNPTNTSNFTYNGTLRDDI